MSRPHPSRARAITRIVLGAIYLAAGVLHLAMPAPFLKITPGWVPMPETVIALTGLAEIAGAVALVQGYSQGLRKAAGIGLALYALCVWPANIHHFAMDMARADHGLGLAYHVPRMVLQPVLIGLALWSAGALPAWRAKEAGDDI